MRQFLSKFSAFPNIGFLQDVVSLWVIATFVLGVLFYAQVIGMFILLMRVG